MIPNVTRVRPNALPRLPSRPAIAKPGLRSLLTVGWIALAAVLVTDPVIRYLLALPHDWAILTEVPERLSSGRLYDLDSSYYWVWSPVAAWLMAWVFVPLGYSFWLWLHLGVVPLMRDVRLIALTLLSVPFWIDTIIGNSFVFVFVAGVLALRGSRRGALAYLALFVLLPRPVQAPLAIWLLWKQPSTRIPFFVMAAVIAIATLASGYTESWLAAVLPFTGASFGGAANYGPTHLLGPAWLAVGVPLAIWLTWKNHLGLAGVAVTPYLLPQYLLVVLWEWCEPARVAESPSSRRQCGKGWGWRSCDARRDSDPIWSQARSFIHGQFGPGRTETLVRLPFPADSDRFRGRDEL